MDTAEIVRIEIARRLHGDAVAFVANVLGVNYHDVQEWAQRYREMQVSPPNAVTTFARENLHPCDGAAVSLKAFYASYVAYWNALGETPESIIAVSRTMRLDYTLGKGLGNQVYIANVAMDGTTKSGEPLEVNDKGRLCPAA